MRGFNLCAGVSALMGRKARTDRVLTRINKSIRVIGSPKNQDQHLELNVFQCMHREVSKLHERGEKYITKGRLINIRIKCLNKLKKYGERGVVIEW